MNNIWNGRGILRANFNKKHKIQMHFNTKRLKIGNDIFYFERPMSASFNALMEEPIWASMMTSSNGSIFRVNGPLCGEFTGSGEFPTQRPVTRNFDVFFDQRQNKRLSKQP